MRLSDALLPEFDHEMANTRRVLERVPDDKHEWRPHPKSATMGWLAAHLTHLPYWAQMTLEKSEIDVQPKEGQPPMPQPKNREELLAEFDKNLANARAAMMAAENDLWMGPWSLKAGDHTIFTMKRAAVMRSFVMNHMVHHRAQLTVYLRLNDIPVPALYGPSADESAF